MNFKVVSLLPTTEDLPYIVAVEYMVDGKIYAEEETLSLDADTYLLNDEA